MAETISFYTKSGTFLICISFFTKEKESDGVPNKRLD
jgi:hypothetical protein